MFYWKRNIKLFFYVKMTAIKNYYQKWSHTDSQYSLKGMVLKHYLITLKDSAKVALTEKFIKEFFLILKNDTNDSRKEWNNEKGYLTDICLTVQNKYEANLNYFRIEYWKRWFSKCQRFIPKCQIDPLERFQRAEFALWIALRSNWNNR